MRKYKSYKLTKKQWLICIAEYFGIVGVFSYVFYDSMLAALLLMPFIVIFIKEKKKKYYKSRQEIISDQFLKTLQSVATSLAAGLSAENAFKEAAGDMERLYGRKALIVRELEVINGQVSLGGRIEDALKSFALRSGSREIEDFAVIFQVAKESGSGFAKIISNCSFLMQERQHFQEETRVLIRGKQYEQRIMSIIPPAIILYLRLSSGSFIELLYHNYLGIAIMTFCLLLYIIAFVIAERICDIT